MKPPDISTPRLELHPLDTSYCTPAYVAWMNDPEVYKFLDTRGNYTLGQLKHYLEDVESRQIYFWAIVLKDGHKHIGNIKIDPVSTTHGFGEYGILMGDRLEWGKGYAKEASSAVISFCFDQLKLRKITLGVVKDNIAAVELYKKMGFQTEGVYKQHVIYDGQVYDVLRMALFNQEQLIQA